MKEYIFNEKQHIKDQIDQKYVNENNPTYTIKNLARYNHYILGLSKTESYKAIHEYMKDNCSIYTEVGYSKAINGCIRDVKKRPFANIDNIIITMQELEQIKQLNDDRKEKLAFVLLADAKYCNKLNNIDANVAWITTRDLYKFARVTMPLGDRAMFLGFLYDEGLVEMNYNPKFTGYNLLYISNDSQDVGLVLTEMNYQELAFTYMNWRDGGYKECEGCGRLIKIRKNTQYCKECSKKYTPIKTKTIICVDCGEEVIVSSKDNQTCMCEECYKKHRRERKTEVMRNLRNK